MKPKCPVCHKPPEMASITEYKYAHYCEEVSRIFYTNGILWSTDREQITGVPR